MEWRDVKDWSVLGKVQSVLRSGLGMRRWNDVNDPESSASLPRGAVLWLFPKEAYAYIPDGTPIVFISGRTGTFKRKTGKDTQEGETDDDHRWGMLAFGVLEQVNCKRCNGKKEGWQDYCGAACAAQAGA